MSNVVVECCFERVFKGLVLDLTLIPTTGKCIFSRSVNSHDTPTTLLEDRASDGKSKESGLASEQSRRRFVLCPRQHRACGAAAVQVRSLRMRVVAVGADETRGKAGRRSAHGICLGINGGRLEIVLIFRPKPAPRARAKFAFRYFQLSGTPPYLSTKEHYASLLPM
jgi:hypothetical protein